MPMKTLCDYLTLTSATSAAGKSLPSIFLTNASSFSRHCVVIIMLTSDSMTRGRIFWLPDPFKDLESEDSDGQPYDLPDTYNGIETGLLGHPVMVLHTLEGTSDVAVCLVSSIICCVPPL